MEPIKQAETVALTITEKVNLVKVTTPEEYEAAGRLWQEIRDTRAKVKELLDPIVDAAHKAHKAATNKRNEIDGPLEIAQRKVKQLMAVFAEAEEKKRLAAEEEARKKAAAEEEERRLAEAESAEAAGLHDIAEEILEAPADVNVHIEKTIPKIDGGPVHRKIWKFRIVNASLIPRMYLQPDEVKIGGVVRSLKGETDIPGIQVYSENV